MSTIVPIAGTDNVVPVYEPTARFTTWRMAEVFLGGPGENRYIPKVNDLVLEENPYQWLKVVSLDPTTWIPVFKKVNFVVDDSKFSTEDLLLSDSPGLPTETFRLYVDKSTIPFNAAVEARCYVRGSMASYARVFKGSEVLGNLKLISAFYDNSGNLLGNNVALELAELDNIQNYTRRTVMPFYTTEDLQDGEVVTIVFYSDTGGVISMRQLIVVNTAFIRTTDASQKFITDITLETPFMSETDKSLIEYPVNVPVRGFNLFGVVHYSDGTSLRMPVDNSKFEIFGLENYVATVIDQKLPLTLKYNLSPGEVCYSATENDGKFMKKHYKLRTIRANGAYSVKLFGYPVWVDAANGYRMEWWLLNLDRKTSQLVTNEVQLGNTSAPFRPLTFGALQNIQVTLDLNKANGIYKKYIHTQSYEVLLRRAGDDVGETRWTVGFEPGQNPHFGGDNRADTYFVNQNLMKVKIGQGCTSLDQWLERLFYRTRPLIDQEREMEAPEPNMFALIVAGVEYEFRIDQWNSELVVNRAIPNNATLFVKFFTRTVETDLVTGLTGLPVYQVA
jgi:hypothetical protein